MHLNSDHQNHWGVILAGGEGARLKSLTRFVSGEDTPKQFCRLLGGQSLLAQTTQRISRKICAERRVYVLLNSHERFYGKELRNVPPARMVVQSCNRGTLPAILSSLIQPRSKNQKGSVALVDRAPKGSAALKSLFRFEPGIV
jgi:mannose-1-phosphate guanylyltransferase